MNLGVVCVVSKPLKEKNIGFFAGGEGGGQGAGRALVRGLRGSLGGERAQARSILVNLGVICAVSKLYKQKTVQKRKTLVVFGGGPWGGGKGGGQSVVSELHKREQHWHWFCWGSNWGGKGAGVNVQSSWRGRRASPALDPNSGVGGLIM